MTPITCYRCGKTYPVSRGTCNGVGLVKANAWRCRNEMACTERVRSQIEAAVGHPLRRATDRLVHA